MLSFVRMPYSLMLSLDSGPYGRDCVYMWKIGNHEVVLLRKAAVRCFNSRSAIDESTCLHELRGGW